MPAKTDPQQGINSWLEEELLQQYRLDRTSVDQDWKDVFEHEAPNGTVSNGYTTSPAVMVRSAAEPVLSGSEELMPLRGAPARIAENMGASASMPLATSQRIIPVKVIDENRRLINQHRTLVGKSKVSYTHLIGWAIVKALEELPGINYAYAEKDGQPYRVVRPQINLGIAVDTAGKDG